MLSDFRITVDPVQHLKVRWFALATPVEPVHELIDLLDETQLVQRVDQDRHVTQPRVAVIPVERAAFCFGQRGRGRSHERTRGLVLEELEHQRRPPDQRLVPALIRTLLQPLAPESISLIAAACRQAPGNGTCSAATTVMVQRDHSCVADSEASC